VGNAIEAIAIGGVDWRLSEEVEFAFARVDAEFSFHTPGPLRSGLADFTLLADTDWGIGGRAYVGVRGPMINEGCGTMGFYCSSSDTMVPILLGATYRADLGAYGAYWIDVGHGGGAQLKMRFFEVDGSAVTPIVGTAPVPNPVPEPGTFVTCAVPLLGVFLASMRAIRCRFGR
jgi:hypothetical protein